jgi:hypothetical protein
MNQMQNLVIVINDFKFQYGADPNGAVERRGDECAPFRIQQRLVRLAGKGINSGRECPPLIKRYLGNPYRLQSSKLTSSTLTSFSPASPPNGAETLFCKIWSISLRTDAASRLVLVAHFDATRSS